MGSLLLKEAHLEISGLRKDLYNTRRLGEERRQAVDALTSSRDQLSKQVEQLTASLALHNQQQTRLTSLETQCQGMQQAMQMLQQELELSLRARKILESELHEERKHKASLADSKSMLESDRSRLQKVRDELSMQLRVAVQRAKEAEAEQVRAEEEASDLKAELQHMHLLSNSLEHASDGSNGTGEVRASSQAKNGYRGPGTSSGSVDFGPLLEQMELERTRAATSHASLMAARAQLAEQQTQLLSSQEELQQLRLQLQATTHHHANADHSSTHSHHHQDSAQHHHSLSLGEHNHRNHQQHPAPSNSHACSNGGPAQHHPSQQQQQQQGSWQSHNVPNGDSPHDPTSAPTTPRAHTAGAGSFAVGEPGIKAVALHPLHPDHQPQRRQASYQSSDGQGLSREHSSADLQHAELQRLTAKVGGSESASSGDMQAHALRA